MEDLNKEELHLIADALYFTQYEIQHFKPGYYDCLQGKTDEIMNLRMKIENLKNKEESDINVRK